MSDDQMTTTPTATEAEAEATSGVAPSPEPQAEVPGSDAQVATSMNGTEEAAATPEADSAAAPEPTAEPVAESASEPTAEATEALAEEPSPAEPAASTEPIAATEPGPAVEAEAPKAPEAFGEQPSDADLFEQALAEMQPDEANKRESNKGVSRGDRIEAEVIQVEKDRVFVNLGTKAEGVVPLSELTDENVDSAIGIVKPGDRFQVVVLKTGSAEGSHVVSKKKADFDATWYGIVDAFEEGRAFEAQVVDRVKGGLVVDIGVRGFVPATHVGNGRLRNIEKYVGQTLVVKIIEIDRERRKVVLSNKAAEDERREEVKVNIFENARPGEVLTGVVRRLTDYGAFIDLGGIDGLLHISEMSWYRIDHPREVLKEGDELQVMVLRLDPNAGRVSLGLRQVLPDPWNLIKDNYKQGQKIKVNVSRIVQSGAFVRLPEGAEAFLPLSECSSKRIKKADEVLTEGEEIEPMIIDLRAEDRRMVLSLRENAQPGADYGYGGRGGERRPGGPGGPGGGARGRRPMRRDEQSTEAPQATMRAPTGGATIGERLAGLKGLLKPGAEEETDDQGS
ncbi:MAG: S1 RNA-binding domain-containing protein [Fimbriimonadaceae bacterium]|nr:S1 RNA-binding domain-containing protein [Fimbriimonadaceae bacterium]QYK55770.1 MAG: S1 RNA-binding domain-containing protein [Fimbriimonadaceae bacterium]